MLQDLCPGYGVVVAIVVLVMDSYEILQNRCVRQSFVRAWGNSCHKFSAQYGGSGGGDGICQEYLSDPHVVVVCAYWPHHIHRMNLMVNVKVDEMRTGHMCVWTVSCKGVTI